MDIYNEYGTRDLQRSLLILLKDFHEFAISNNIQYSLAYGSLLGAVRHQGFIPWDDDVDICVTRDNFNKLKLALSQQSSFIWKYQDEDSKWTGRISKGYIVNDLYPPMIDVFIIDNVPNNIIIQKLKLFLVYTCQGLVKTKLSIKKGNLFFKFCAICTWFIGLFFTQSFKYRLYEKICQISNNSYSKEYAIYNTIFEYIPKKFSRSIINNYNLVPFEDTNLYIISGYDEFLKIHYGNYMLPPKVKLGKHIHPEVGIQ
ncbi:MAG: LicD family protein [Bacteroidales bacterium]|nr:LicD family protein [Bacteroidales bacterium]